MQIDASHHDWFESRAPKCCLIAYIDDATGDLKGARFEPSETTQGYLGVLHVYVSKHGAPLALYSDRHSIFTKHDVEDAKPAQFERAALQLGIEVICAHSPQAKGRVERLFQTLQDRMCRPCVWRASKAWRRPTPGYRATSGATTSALPSRHGSLRTCTDAGWDQPSNWLTSARCTTSVN